MKILIVTQYFWPENFRINDLVVGLVRRGHQVTVLTGQPNYPAGTWFAGHGMWRPWRQTFEGVPVLRCPHLRRGRGGGLRLMLNYLSFALSGVLLGPLRCTDRYDAIFVYEPSPITVALPALVLRMLRRGPVLLWVLDLWPESVQAAGNVRSKPLLAAIRALVRFIYRNCDFILVQSRGFIERVQQLDADPARVRYFPSWAEDVYSQVGGELPVPWPEGFCILFAGNIGIAQDFDNVLAAAERLREHPEIHWMIVGDGRQAAWVREQVRARGLAAQVHLPGPFPLNTMPAFHAAAAALLVSLKRDPIFALTIPAKVQSYLACGRPIVGMLDGEGARVIAASGAGVVGPAEDPLSLAENVLLLYRMSPQERERMGEAGRATYRREFRREKLMEQLEDWMVEAADAHKGSLGPGVNS